MRAADREEAMINMPFIPSRREILKTAAARSSSAFACADRRATHSPQTRREDGRADRGRHFLAIDRGPATIYSGKVDLGTGVRTALTQIVAEELDVPMSTSSHPGRHGTHARPGSTYGSLSIQNGGVQIRQAAATGEARALTARRCSAPTRTN